MADVCGFVDATGSHLPQTRAPQQRPFLALKDTEHASSDDVQKLYEQATSASSIAYHLFVAAESLSRAEGKSVVVVGGRALPQFVGPDQSVCVGVSRHGRCTWQVNVPSSNALLPYLTPVILKLYTSHPERRTSPAAVNSYSLSWSLYRSSPTLQSCHYDLYTSLGAAFSWVRDNIPLRLQEVSGQPLASAAWPDMSRTTPLKLAARVAEALLRNNSLGDTASQLNASCGLAAADFAALVPNISSVLIDLHADLPLLQDIAKQLYGNSCGALGPAQYDQAPVFIDLMVRLVNLMAKPTNFSFFVKEVRNNATTFPSLVVGNRSRWLDVPFCEEMGCLNDNSYVSSLVADFPRSINVFVAADSTSGSPGAAYAPGSDTYPAKGLIFVTWDSISISGFNSPALYNEGSRTLLHEIFHHLGLTHPFGKSYSCDDDDYVLDTPVSLGPVYANITLFKVAIGHCMEVFWNQLGGSWDAAYKRMASRLGIPEADMNAWADSCPDSPGYDELGNYMTYSAPVCFAALGHFTLGQALRAHYVTSERNRLMYAWGQYYASTAPPPPPVTSSLPYTWDYGKVTAGTSYPSPQPPSPLPPPRPPNPPPPPARLRSPPPPMPPPLQRPLISPPSPSPPSPCPPSPVPPTLLRPPRPPSKPPPPRLPSPQPPQPSPCTASK
ncbi:hypothetical protein VOLCADRAFT_93909 [Volvox carteri f. nagariensis]|uniref:Peptidase M43 pregnancy-associated plasma-A domain-containing protein n=1 Tax=Volvox carteri f. nagariensis TaxID=3068 RepID=D8U3E1_VOLCA|nr:uncharacterized protein VOLCADRAFT_93909 [Volvox carteri f. nagariensis]EFJ45736.1 hypothetical protein VOLCADRAFT_93909 [Volvox carteri f. nagariensis]|eukprot:XP_002953137.1 hypothetical protein VOLCADRAFT_93909 [Volvox carteri f. nagariensis]